MDDRTDPQPHTTVPPTPVFRADQPVVLGAAGSGDAATLPLWEDAVRVVGAQRLLGGLGCGVAVAATVGLAATLSIACDAGGSNVDIAVIAGSLALLATAGYWCWFAPSLFAAVTLALFLGAGAVALIGQIGRGDHILMLLTVATGLLMAVIVAAVKLTRLPVAGPARVAVVWYAVRVTRFPFVPRRQQDCVSLLVDGGWWQGSRGWHLLRLDDVAIATDPANLVALSRAQVAAELRHPNRLYVRKYDMNSPSAKPYMVKMSERDEAVLRAWMVGRA